MVNEKTALRFAHGPPPGRKGPITMYKPKLEKDIRCPLEYGLDIFGGKWNARILCVLNSRGTIRYSQLRKDLYNITDAVLSGALKSLIANEMVERIQYNEIPPRVEYKLSPKGESAIPILQSICRWSGVYQKDGEGDVVEFCRHCDYHGYGEKEA